MLATRRILVTGFEPFGGETLNPSELVLDQLPDEIDSFEIVKRLLIVDRYAAIAQIVDAVAAAVPTMIVGLGQSGRPRIDVEHVFINLYETEDVSEPVIAGGPAAYFSTLPLADLKVMSDEDLPITKSLSAGAYVCNTVAYFCAHRYGTEIPNGFVHLPYVPEQRPDGEVPTVALDVQVAAVSRLIELSIEALEDPHS